MPEADIAEPWNSFLRQLDAHCTAPVELHCCGGFVVTQRYGLPRATADVDIISARPRGQAAHLLAAAGRDSAMHRQYGIYLDFVAVALMPEDYEQRLTEMFAGHFQWLRLFALDVYDLALSKLERNLQRDRDDVKYLARTIPFDLTVLRQRYEQEMRPYLANPAREDLTLQLWIEAISEECGDQRWQ